MGSSSVCASRPLNSSHVKPDSPKDVPVVVLVVAVLVAVVDAVVVAAAFEKAV